MNLGEWIQSNWGWIVLLWPVVSAVASLLYGIADKSPRWHAAFSLLAALGIDIPKILDAINRWINKDPPMKGSGGHSPTLKFPSRRKPPPPPPMAGRVGFAFAARPRELR